VAWQQSQGNGDSSHSKQQWKEAAVEQQWSGIILNNTAF